MDDQPHYGDCCRVVGQSSNGSSSGWNHLLKVLAELEARRDSHAPPSSDPIDLPKRRPRARQPEVLGYRALRRTTSRS